ncbi:unnamed protein product [Lepeophtheirus salmonis]|uniref:(salmon louse) hypothetical protein n=1 Tax=Lepeophtheirus salmonis TaxID=72036 RepID=A0A7R8CLX3_LEPSM|nr:unnamed protein product [Lepeophtheirus salmonis]CAF2816670.1 unnamed protein product [Lepeophtheirus salmonis]
MKGRRKLHTLTNSMEKDGEDSSAKVSSNDGERNSQRKENDMSTCSATQMDEMNKSSAEKNNPADVSEVESVHSNIGMDGTEELSKRVANDKLIRTQKNLQNHQSWMRL